MTRIPGGWYRPAGAGTDLLLGANGAVEIPVHLLAVAARLWAIAAELVVLALALTLRFSEARRDP